MKTKINLILISCIVLFTSFAACEKMVEIAPPANQLTSTVVFSDSVTLNGALVDLYVRLNRSIDVAYNKYLGLYADEVVTTRTTLFETEFLTGHVSPENSSLGNIWNRFYFNIYQANDIIEHLQSSSTLSLNTSNKAIAEAKFLRAFAFYHLFNCFGDIPLILTTEVSQTSIAPRVDSTLIFQQILGDLKSAEQSFSEYDNHTKTRANKWATIALLARIMLHQTNWEEAERLSSEIIHSGLFTLEPLQQVFQSNSREAILHLWTQNGFIQDAASLIPSSGIPAYLLSEHLLNTFEPEDQRKQEWINSTVVNDNTYYYPFKYKNRVAASTGQEYLSILRLSEQFLIRAEARAHQQKTAQAVDDLNVVRERAGLSPLPTSISVAECLQAIEKERQTELFLEWGQRFADLKRTGKLNTTLSEIKANWTSYSIHLPIPQNELTYNSNLTQNPGY